MGLIPKIAGRWLALAAGRVAARIHAPETAGSGDDWDCIRDGSEFACAAAMFRRAAQSLDGMHPDLARLLAHNRDRDIATNAQLTRLADEADAWRVRAETAREALACLETSIASALARIEAAEAGARACRVALTRMQARYVAFCAAELSKADATQALEGAADGDGWRGHRAFRHGGQHSLGEGEMPSGAELPRLRLVS